MQNYSKTGGVLAIVGGGLGVLIGLFYVLFFVFAFRWLVHESFRYSSPGMPPEIINVFTIIYAAIGGIIALIGLTGISGGVYSLIKKNWGMALAGAVCSAITFFPCGIAAVIFVSMARPEFVKPGPTSGA